MRINKTITLTRPLVKLELSVRTERKDTHGGQLDVDLVPVDGSYDMLAISMGQWVRRSPHDKWNEDCFGQGIDTVREFARGANEPVKRALLRLCEIWAEWHLNDMQAGTATQTEAIGAAEKADELQMGDWYGSACKALEARGLLVDRGYKFGSRWLVKRLPMAIASEVVSLCETLEAAASQ